MKKQLLFEFTRFLFREKHLRNAVYAVLFLLTAQSSFAQTTTVWEGTTADFLTGSNWNPVVVTFNSGDVFTINSVTSPKLNPVLNSAATCTSVTANAGSIFTINAALTFTGNTATAGTMTVNAGATLYTNANVTPSSTSTSANLIAGTININGGTYKSRLTIGTATGLGSINVASGGTLELISACRLGQVAGSSGILNVNGGTLKYTGASSSGLTIGGGTSGILNMNGGTFDYNCTTTGPLAIGNNAQLNINSGTVTYTTTTNSLSITGTGVINIDAGSLVLVGDKTTLITGYINGNQIKVSGAALLAGKILSNTYDSGTGKTTVVAVTPASTTWDGTAWSNGTPSSSVHAIIDGTYSTTTNGAFTALVLTVNSGKSLTINTGTNVTVQNQLINNGTLLVENNANLIQVNGATNTGNVVVNRNSNALSRLDYTLWSSPVASQNLAAFSPLTSQSPSRFYTYTPGTPDVYTVVASPTTTNFAAGNGYLIRMPNTAVTYPTTETFAGVFTGVPNNGTVSRTGLTAGKFYAVGNPYPSTISAASFLSGNSTAGTTLYFWRKTNGVANSGSSYATWTNVGGTAAGNVAPNDIVPNGSIQVGQGFVVNTNTATSLTFTNAMREAAPSSTQFLKIKDVAEKSRIWLNLTSTGLFSQTLVGYLDGATEGVDSGIDGKYINDSPIALTSNIDGEEYTIQGRPAFDASDVVALNFKTDKAGEYKIAIDHTDGVFAKGQAVYLADSVTGKETDLTKEAYTFTAESGTANNRFTLKYQSSSKTVGSPVFNENTVTVYKNNGTLYVNSAASAIVTIKVFNLQGRLIGEQKDVNATIAAIKNLKATQQVLFVQVTSADNKVVTKKVVN